MNFEKIRSVLVKLILGALVIAAAIAVIALLVGQWGETASRSIGTVFAAVIYLAILLWLVNATAPREVSIPTRSINVVINSIAAIVVLGFATTVAQIWGSFDGTDMAMKLYMTYIVLVIALLHYKAIDDIALSYNRVTKLSIVNYALIAIVSLMIIVAFFAPSGLDLIGGFYGRLLAALMIIDVTISIVVATMYRLYIQKNPGITASEVKKRNHAAVIVVGILILIFIVYPIAMVILAVQN